MPTLRSRVSAGRVRVISSPVPSPGIRQQVSGTPSSMLAPSYRTWLPLTSWFGGAVAGTATSACGASSPGCETGGADEDGGSDGSSDRWLDGVSDSGAVLVAVAAGEQPGAESGDQRQHDRNRQPGHPGTGSCAGAASCCGWLDGGCDGGSARGRGMWRSPRSRRRTAGSAAAAAGPRARAAAGSGAAAGSVGPPRARRCRCASRSAGRIRAEPADPELVAAVRAGRHRSPDYPPARERAETRRASAPSSAAALRTRATDTPDRGRRTG